MWTLKSYLEALTHLGGYVVMEANGFAWPADELIDWLAWQAPEQLAVAVGFSAGPDHQNGGVLYALDEHGTVVGFDPLYWITPRQLAPPPGLPPAKPGREDALASEESKTQRKQEA